MGHGQDQEFTEKSVVGSHRKSRNFLSSLCSKQQGRTTKLFKWQKKLFHGPFPVLRTARARWGSEGPTRSYFPLASSFSPQRCPPASCGPRPSAGVAELGGALTCPAPECSAPETHLRPHLLQDGSREQDQCGCGRGQDRRLPQGWELRGSPEPLHAGRRVSRPSPSRPTGPPTPGIEEENDVPPPGGRRALLFAGLVFADGRVRRWSMKPQTPGPLQDATRGHWCSAPAWVSTSSWPRPPLKALSLPQHVPNEKSEHGSQPEAWLQLRLVPRPHVMWRN